jgi:hypothetical protein
VSFIAMRTSPTATRPLTDAGDFSVIFSTVKVAPLRARRRPSATSAPFKIDFRLTASSRETLTDRWSLAFRCQSAEGAVTKVVRVLRSEGDPHDFELDAAAEAKRLVGEEDERRVGADALVVDERAVAFGVRRSRRDQTAEALHDEVAASVKRQRGVGARHRRVGQVEVARLRAADGKGGLTAQAKVEGDGAALQPHEGPGRVARRGCPGRVRGGRGFCTSPFLANLNSFVKFPHRIKS